MPTYKFEAMDAQGDELKDVIEAPSEEEAQATIRAMGYFVTKLSVQKAKAQKARRRQGEEEEDLRHRRRAAPRSSRPSPASSPSCRTPACRSCAACEILEDQSKPGPLKNALIDVCEDIESGNTLSEAMAKQPKAFDRLYVNMVKAGEAGGALEIILQRLADFLEKAQSLKSKVNGAMIYPVVVVLRGRRHPDVHHDQDRADVREDLQGVRRRAAGP